RRHTRFSRDWSSDVCSSDLSSAEVNELIRQLDESGFSAARPVPRILVLHANFKLSADGEYLALIKPDGKTVCHAYAPKYPNQIRSEERRVGKECRAGWWQ